MPESKRRYPIKRLNFSPVFECVLLIAVVGLFNSQHFVRSALAQGFSPTEAVKRMQVPAGFAVKLYAAEPEIRQPIFVKFDERGRLWVIQYLQYPTPAGLQRVKTDRWSRTVFDRLPEPPPRGPKGADRITILSDSDGDGRADKFHDFLTGMNLVTGLAFGHGGVFVLQAPYLLFYADRDRNDVPDGDPEVILTGFGMEDAQSLANHLTWGPDGWLYGVNGSTTTCRIRDVEFQQGVWRYHPRSKEFELFCEGGGNLFGLTFDAFGNLLYSSNGDYLCFHAMQGAYYPKNYGKHGPLHNAYAYGTLSNVQYTGMLRGPTTGGTIYVGDAFPPPYHGAFVGGDFLGHSVSWWQLRPEGSTFTATLGGSLLDARDSWFGPTDVCLGPEGSIYVCDFYDRRTAHPDPDASWDRSNGRIYKVEAADAKRAGDFDLARKSSSELVALLTHRNCWYAEQARSLLAARRDPAILPQLLESALQTDNHGLALQSLWALYVSGGFDESVALRLIQHPNPYVRCWTVRLLGDQRVVSSKTAAVLADLARTDASVVVRAQLAASAKRLPGSAGLGIITTLLERNGDRDDPNVPWLIWWAIESKTTSDREAVVQFFAREQAWQNGSMRQNIFRLVRRYAAAGTTVGYDACVKLLEKAPPSEVDEALGALDLGLAERARTLGDVGPGDLFADFADPSEPATVPVPRFEPVSGDLKTAIKHTWRDKAEDSLRMRLAIRAGIEEAYQRLLSQVADRQTNDHVRLQGLQSLREVAKDDCVPVLLPLIDSDWNDDVRVAALSVLGGFDSPAVTTKLLALYPAMPASLREQTRTVLFSRSDSALAFLRRVDERAVVATDVSLANLRQAAVHANSRVDELVRKHYGQIQAGTSEERLAQMRRMTNDLRAAAGDPVNGRILFRKHCATCHKLHGEGGDVGPDLTAANRKDRDFLLVSLVDPGAVVRREFATYALATTSGQVLSGLIAEQDAAAVTLLDEKGVRHRVARSEIEQVKELTTSLMPERLLEGLSPDQLRDLFAYLQGEP